MISERRQDLLCINDKQSLAFKKRIVSEVLICKYSYSKFNSSNKSEFNNTTVETNNVLNFTNFKAKLIMLKVYFINEEKKNPKT